MRPYDKTKIGKFLGYGGEHIVYEYGDDKVIKFSLHMAISGRVAIRKKVSDYEIGRQYFNEYLLATEIIEWRNGRRAVEIQEKIAHRFFHKDDLRNPVLRRQFDDIMARYRRMEADTGWVFDLFGREGLLSLRRPQKISNILVSGEQLRLNDFTLLAITARWWELPLLAFIHWAQRRQAKLLERFLENKQ